MKYTKKPLTIPEQIEHLKKRGLIFDDENVAQNYLSHISYYRLRAYTYPFQDNKDISADHRFIRNDIHFSDIIDLYCFDRRLRILLFNAIEKIEIAIRTKIVLFLANDTKDSHWFTNRQLYKTDEGKITFDLLIDEITKEVDRSKEDFIKHYKDKYGDPVLPPSWMTLEVLSLGTLSRLYALLLPSDTKTRIAKSLGLPNEMILSNWLHAISTWRNFCAHHSRVWNRRAISHIQLSYNTTKPFLTKKEMRNIHDNKVFAVLCCIKYLSDIISPTNNFKQNLIEIIQHGGNLLSLKEMGFPDNWENLGVWMN